MIKNKVTDSLTISVVTNPTSSKSKASIPKPVPADFNYVLILCSFKIYFNIIHPPFLPPVSIF